MVTQSGTLRFLRPNLLWLELNVEPVLEPDLPILDAHHHLWEMPGNTYQIADLRADARSGHNVVATIFVECAYAYTASGPSHLKPVGETIRIQELAAASAGIEGFEGARGIVGHANLSLGDGVGEVIERHLEAAPDRFCGVRHSTARDENYPNGISVAPAEKGMMEQAGFRLGVSVLARHNLVFDAWIYHPQLTELYELAVAVPATKIVVNHFGGPLGIGPYRGREDEVFAAWKKGAEKLAKLPNVFMKMGGLGMPLGGRLYFEHPEPPSSAALSQNWRPYIRTSIDLFGVERCMFESNFPVDKGMYSYRTLWNAFKRSVSDLSNQEKKSLFGQNARNLYGLNDRASIL